MEWITKILTLEKIPTNILVVCFLSTFSLLFFPVRYLEILSLLEFKNNFNAFIGPTFFVSAILLISSVLKKSINWGKAHLNKHRISKEIKTTINSLDLHEKSVLREFFLTQQHTIQMPIDDPVVSGLLSKFILNRVGSVGQNSIHGLLFNVSISKHAQNLITAELIGLPPSAPSEEELQNLRHIRPEWAKKIQAYKSLFNF